MGWDGAQGYLTVDQSVCWRCKSWRVGEVLGHKSAGVTFGFTERALEFKFFPPGPKGLAQNNMETALLARRAD